MLQVKSLRSWNMNAPEMEATVRFYRDVLGATEGRTSTVGGVNVAHVSLGGLTLGFFDASEGPRPGVPHHTIEIEWPGDAETVTRELEVQGVKVENVRQHREGPGYSLYVTDPAGNRLELATGQG